MFIPLVLEEKITGRSDGLAGIVPIFETRKHAEIEYPDVEVLEVCVCVRRSVAVGSDE